MSGLERLLALADERTIEIARELIGRERLAVLIAQSVISQTSARLETKEVADLLDIKEDVARRILRNEKDVSNKI